MAKHERRVHIWQLSCLVFIVIASPIKKQHTTFLTFIARTIKWIRFWFLPISRQFMCVFLCWFAFHAWFYHFNIAIIVGSNEKLKIFNQNINTQCVHAETFDNFAASKLVFRTIKQFLWSFDYTPSSTYIQCRKREKNMICHYMCSAGCIGM